MSVNKKDTIMQNIFYFSASKTSRGHDALMEAPNSVDNEKLREYGLLKKPTIKK